MIQHKQLMVDRRRASLSSQHELSDIVGQSSLLSGRNSSNSVCEANMGSRAMSRASSRMSSRNGLSSAAGSSSRLLSKMHSIDTGDVELSSMRERLQQPQEEVHDMLLNHHHHHHHYHHPPLPVSPLAMETANINSGANVAFSPPTLKNYPVEMRRIVKNECLIRKGSSPSRFIHNLSFKFIFYKVVVRQNFLFLISLIGFFTSQLYYRFGIFAVNHKACDNVSVLTNIHFVNAV